MILELETRAAELQQSNRELERSNRELQDFAYLTNTDLGYPIEITHPPRKRSRHKAVISRSYSATILRAEK